MLKALENFYFKSKNSKHLLCFRHAKYSIGGTLFCKEKEMVDVKSDINVALLIKFKSVVGQKEIDCKFKKIDEVTSVLLTGNKHFELHKCVKRLTIETGGDHRKGALTILLTIHIEMMDGAKRCMNELIAEIDHDKNNIEVL